MDVYFNKKYLVNSKGNKRKHDSLKHSNPTGSKYEPQQEIRNTIEVTSANRRKITDYAKVLYTCY